MRIGINGVCHGERRCRRAMALITMLLLPAMQLPVLAQPLRVEIIRNPEYKEVRYCVFQDGCRLCWEAYETQINAGVVKSRTDCRLSLQAQSPGLKALLEKSIAADSGRPAVHTLFWGRLVPDVPQDDMQMAKRLALAAFQSPGWDCKKGRPRSGDDNPFVRDLANGAMIYEELRALFAFTGRRIHMSGVEKVLVGPAGQLPFYDELAAQGVGRGDRLPFDALVWFTIEAPKKEGE